VRRSLLLTTSVLGLLICLVGGTGLFAALTDSAHTGTNSVDTAALPSSAYLQLAAASQDPTAFTCGDFSDDLATGPISYSDAPASGFGGIGTALCIRNAGSQSVSLAASIDQLADIDLACTGDEADLGDTTCGNDLQGELSGVLNTTITTYNCNFAATPLATYQPGMLATLANSPQAIGSIDPGVTICLFLNLSLDPAAVPAGALQRAQSDKVTWRFVFTGQA
jgi:hypothetical protein